jgi:hypothetical protein
LVAAARQGPIAIENTVDQETLPADLDARGTIDLIENSRKSF